MATTRSTNPPEQPAEQLPVNPLAGRVVELEAENAALREQLADLLRAATELAPVKPGKVAEPSFVFTEGQRDELARTGRTVSPFTGKRYVGSGPDDAREATAEEFANAKPAKPAGK